MRANGVPPNTISYNSLISACREAGQWERAWGVLDQMEAEGLRADVVTYNALISVCEKANQWRHAFAVLERMRVGDATGRQEGVRRGSGGGQEGVRRGLPHLAGPPASAHQRAVRDGVRLDSARL
eukprot:413060-Prorocentrum_minimum.AAC.1